MKTNKTLILTAAVLSTVSMGAYASNVVTGTDAAAFGKNNVVAGSSAFAGGYSNTINSQNSIVAGTLNEVNKNTAGNGSALVIGDSNTVAASSVLAGGYANKITGNNSVVNGIKNTVASDNSDVTGQNNNVSGLANIVGGNTNNVDGSYNITTGYKNATNGTSNVVGGYLNKAIANNTLVVGMNNKATANEAFVGGQLSKASGEGSIAYGYANEATKLNSVALGNQTKASADFATATGYLSEAKGGWSFAAGNQSKAIGNGSVAFGNKNKAIGLHSFTAGDNNVAYGGNATALGNFNTVAGVSSFATGQNNTVSKDFGTAIGTNNSSNGEASFVGGNGSTAQGDNAFAFGYKTQAIGDGNIAMGKYANATGKDSLALGRDSVASADNTNALGQNAVASGENATAIGHGSESAGRNSNALGSSAKATADFSTAVGNSAKANGVSSTATGFNALAKGNFSTAYGNDAQAKGNRSVAVGYNARAEESAVAIGNNSNAGAVNAVAVGAGNAVTGIKSSAFGVGNTVAQANTHVLGNEIATTQANSVVVGNKSTDRAATTEEEAEINGLKYGNFAGKGSVSNGVMSIGSVGGERQLINVAAGKVSADSTDAVNGSQLYAVAQNVSNVANSTKNVIGGNATVDQNGNITTNNIGGTGESTIDAAIKKVNAKATGLETGSDNVTVTSKTNATGDKTYTVDVNKDLKLNSVTTGDTKIDNNGLSVAGKTYISKDGLNANNQKVTNVANGRIAADSKDAVNGSQLHKVNQNIKALAGGIGELGGIVNEHDTLIQNNTTLANNAMAEAKKHTSVSAGNNVTVSTSTNAAGGTDYKVSVDKVKFGNVSLDDKGLNNGGNKITNVADGTIAAGSKDAVNGGQLNTVVNNISNRYDGLTNRVAKLDERVNKVGASAAALAALHPQDFNPDDKWSVAAGYGNYKGENAAALGAFYRPNENTMFSVAATIGSENMVNAGVSIKFGHSDKLVSNSRVAMAREMQDMKATIEAQNKKIELLVNMLLGNNDKVKDTVFPDVPENHWAYTLVNDLAQRGYIDGYEDGQFKGDRLMTRYEFAAMLDRAVQNGAAINQEMADAIREFKPELDQIKASMRFHVDRISGEDTDLHKVERVRVNTESNRDQYGTVVTK